MPPSKGFIPEICKLKHSSIDKDISEIKDDIEEIKNEEKIQHEEIKDMIDNLLNESKLNHQNLKNKIVLVNKSMGDKIDDLNTFDEKLRGNGDPGIWESVRNIKRNIKIMMWTVIVMAILMLGGNYRGVSIESIRKNLGFGDKPQTKQVTPVSAPKTIPPPISMPKDRPKIIPK